MRTEFSRPGAVVFGAGVEQELGPHVGVRADAQLLAFLVVPIGARFTGSVSIPFGRYERR